jgi:hypothetical protein
VAEKEISVGWDYCIIWRQVMNCIIVKSKLFVCIVFSLLLLNSSYSYGACTGEANLGDFVIRLSSVSEYINTNEWVFYYEYSTNDYTTNLSKYRPFLFGIKYDPNDQIIIEGGPNTNYYPLKEGALYCNQGSDFTHAYCSDHTEKFGFNEQVRVFSYDVTYDIDAYWPSPKMKFVSNTDNLSCITISWMDSEFEIHSAEILGPAPAYTPPPPSPVVIPESYAKYTYEEINLPDANMHFRLVRGSDGCATQVETYNVKTNTWAPVPANDSEWVFKGMPGQICPETIIWENPCYYYSGKKWYEIPCPQ